MTCQNLTPCPSPGHGLHPRGAWKPAAPGSQRHPPVTPPLAPASLPALGEGPGALTKGTWPGSSNAFPFYSLCFSKASEAFNPGVGVTVVPQTPWGGVGTARARGTQQLLLGSGLTRFEYAGGQDQGLKLGIRTQPSKSACPSLSTPSCGGSYVPCLVCVGAQP